MIVADEKVNILLVDDRPDKLLAVEAILEGMGQNIVRAYSGREALREVLAQDFAVILLDVNMPGMDGFETAELIRNRKSSEHIPIIFITAFGDEMHMARSYSLGAVDYISAPVVPEILRSKVAVFVDLSRKTEQVKRQAEALRRRAAQLQQLAAASLAINAARSVEKMLQTVTDTAATLIGAHQAVTIFVDYRTDRRQHSAQSYVHFSEKYAEWRSKPLDLNPLTETLVYRSLTPTRMAQSELLEHPDWQVVQGAEVPPISGGLLACPLLGRDRVQLGIVYLSDRVQGDFTAADETLLVQLTQVASIAVENALFAEEREANRLKDEFLCTLSHELRTPLNAILGWTQLLQAQPLQEDVEHAVEVIERNARAQTRLIEDMLDVSRITTGKLRMNPEDTLLTPILQSALDAVSPAAEAKQISLKASLPPASEAVWIRADADRLQQVAWNLLTNAVKFTPAGGTVWLDLRAEGPHAIFRVSDSGRGISPAFLPQVFDAFRQGDSTPTRSHGGLGIGLTIVRHIVELHGGRVAAESGGVGLGATFSVTLPLRPGPGRIADESTSRSAGVATHPASGGGPRELAGLRILVVDDEPDTLEVIRQILLGAGGEVEVVTSAHDGLRALVHMRPDVLISDIAMPQVDGFTFIKSVRQLSDESGGRTPALALTAYAREEDRLRALAAGFQHHLPKPVDPGELKRVIRACADRHAEEWKCLPVSHEV